MIRIFLILIFSYISLFASYCVDVFASGIQAEQKIEFGWNAYLSNEDDVTLEVPTISSNMWQMYKTCDTSSCIATGSSRTSSNVISFPSFTGKQNVNIGWGSSLTLAPDTYRDVKYNGATLYLSDGDYYFKSLEASDSGRIVVTNGTARVFVLRDIKTGSNGLINSSSKEHYLDPSKLILYSNRNIITGDSTTISAYSYAKRDIKDSKIYVKGSLSAKKVELNSNSRIVTDLTNISSINFGDLCQDGEKPLNEPKSNFKFDSLMWNSSDNEVVDSTLNGNDGIAYDIEPSDESKLCKSADFTKNSTSDYIKLNKNILNGLDDLTISFWIKASSTNGQQEILQGLGRRVSDEIELYLYSDNKLRVKVKDNSKTYYLHRDELTDDSWHYVVFTRRDRVGCLYIDSILKECQSGFKRGALKIYDNSLILGQEQDDYGSSFNISQDFEGYLDELVTFDEALDSRAIKSIYQNYMDGKNYDGSLRICSSEDENSSNVSSFIVYDEYRDISDQNISTKIVGESFNLVLASVDENGTNYKEFNGTVCLFAKIYNTQTRISEYKKVFFSDETNKTISFNIQKAYKMVDLNISWKNDIDETCPLNIEENSTLSKDIFALRPKKFEIDLDSDFYSGDDFNITFKALDFNSNYTQNYNEENSTSFNVNTTDIKVGCTSKSLEFNEKLIFEDGYKKLVSTYDDIGDIKLMISEIIGSEFASVDVDDTNDTQRLIEPYSVIINLKPYELNVTYSEINSSTNLDWIYMADVNDINITLTAEVQASDKNHKSLDDFNSTCYANDINITFNLNSDGNSSYSINYISLLNDFSDLSSNKKETLGDINQTLTLKASSFIDGKSKVKMVFNVDRKADNPINPFSVSGVGVEINTTNLSKNIYNDTDIDDKNITLYFGRVKAKDLETSLDDVEHFLEIEVYDSIGTKYTSTFIRNSLKWYKNKKHNENQSGNATSIEATKTTIYNNVKFDISDIKTPKNGEIDFSISKHNGSYIMHIKIQRWLWYILKGFGSEYNASVDSDCTSHPCFTYVYQDNKVEEDIKISSGDFSGTSIKVKPKGNYERKGIKIFR